MKEVVWSKLQKFSGFVLIYNLAVIVWGAWVRVSLSGDGCGKHWPTCGGELVPSLKSAVPTWIEYIHRASSGLCLVFVLILFGMTRTVASDPSHQNSNQIKKYSNLSLIFTLTEALLGAALVLGGWVALDKSVIRAVSTVLHLGNTFLLLRSLALLTWYSFSIPTNPVLQNKKWGPIPFQYVGNITLLFFIITGMSGGLTALGDTLFQSKSLIEGILSDFSPYSHFLLKVRVFHPMLAILLVSGIWILSYKISPKLGFFLKAMTLVTFGIGVLNLGLMAPAPLQLLHLFCVDVLWILLSIGVSIANPLAGKPAV